MTAFVRTDDRSKGLFTCLQGEVTVPGARLVELFGKPLPSIDGKNTGDFIFIDEYGNAATVYDWRNKSLHVWKSNEPFTFHVGAKTPDIAYSFITWLHETIGE